MPVFEKDRGSRRFYSLSTESLPSSTGGIPIGSMLTYTDTGDQFIFNGKTWDTFVGAEDLLGILIEIAGFLDGQTPLLRAIVCGMNHLTGLDLAEEVQEQTD